MAWAALILGATGCNTQPQPIPVGVPGMTAFPGAPVGMPGMTAAIPGMPMGMPMTAALPGFVPAMPMTTVPGVAVAAGKPQDAMQPIAEAPGQPGLVAIPDPPNTTGRCLNTCQYRNDRECDDGRPGAHTSLCPRGSDCNDCGPVGRAFRRGGVAAAGNNSCQHANDNECDDGRPGSHTSLCARGTDENDCRRLGGGAAVAAGANSCQHANDNECDDGRPGSNTSLCARGTDENDCRNVAAPGAGGGAAGAGGGGACTNTCQHANDNECDDGRPGSQTSLCPRGSDCNDCGPG